MADSDALKPIPESPPQNPTPPGATVKRVVRDEMIIPASQATQGHGGNGSRWGQGPSGMAGGAISNEAAKRRMDDWSKEPAHAASQLEIYRLAPSAIDNQRVNLNAVLDRLPIQEYQGVYDHILNTHGGGRYRILIRDSSNTPQGVVMESISETQYPPILQAPMSGPQRGGNRPMGGYDGIPGAARDADELVKARTQMEIKKLQHHENKMDMQMTLEMEQLQDQKRAMEERKEKMALAPLEEARTREERAREREAEARREEARRFEASLKSQAEANKEMMMLLLANQKKDDGSGTALAAMMQTMQASQQAASAAMQSQMQQFMTLMMEQMKTMREGKAEEAKTQSDNLKETIKLITEANKGNTKSEEKMNELMMNMANSVINGKINQGNDSVKSYVEALQQGEDRAWRMFDLMDKRRDGDDDDIGPDAGPWATIINKGLNIWAGKQNAEGRSNPLLDNYNRAMGRPQGTKLSEQDLQALVNEATPAIANRLMAMAQAQGMPGPQGQPPQPQLPGPTQDLEGLGEDEPEHGPPLVQPIPQQPGMPAQAGGPTPAMMPGPQGQPQQMAGLPAIPAPTVPAGVAPDNVPSVESRRRQTVTGILQRATEEFRQGKAIVEWPNLGPHLDGELAGNLAKMNDADKVKTLQQWCDVRVWGTLFNFLANPVVPNYADNYRRFLEGLRFLTAHVAPSA